MIWHIFVAIHFFFVKNDIGEYIDPKLFRLMLKIEFVNIKY